MRSFIISLSALIVLFVFVFLNSFFVSKFSSEMKEMVDKIEDVGSTEQILEICDAWERRKFFISLSVPHKQTDEVEKMLSILLEKSLHKAENEFFETKALLVNAISEISNHGAINLDNILCLTGVKRTSLKPCIYGKIPRFSIASVKPLVILTSLFLVVC